MSIVLLHEWMDSGKGVHPGVHLWSFEVGSSMVSLGGWMDRWGGGGEDVNVWRSEGMTE